MDEASASACEWNSTYLLIFSDNVGPLVYYSHLLPLIASLLLGFFVMLASNDAVLVLNIPQRGVEGYIGAAVLMEIGLAYYLRKKIFLLNSVSPKERYIEDVTILGAVILNGDLAKIPISGT